MALTHALTGPAGTDAHAAAAIMAHPSLAAHAPDVAHDNNLDAVHAALRLPHTTGTSRARLLGTVGTVELTTYVTSWQDAHPDAVTVLADRDPVPDRLTPHIRRLRWWYALAGHRSSAPDVRAAAVRGLLSYPAAAHAVIGAGAPFRDAFADWLVTCATRTPQHLPAAAAVAHDARTRAHLDHLAAVAEAGGDPHGTWLATLRPTPTSTAAQWAHAVYASADPDIADTALELHPTTTTVRAVLGTGHLDGTRAHLRARVLRDAFRLPPAHGGADAGAYRHALADAVVRWAHAGPVSDVPSWSGAGDLDVAWQLADRLGYGTDDPGATGRYLAHLALHPATPPARAAHLAVTIDRLAQHGSNHPSVAATLAAAADVAEARTRGPAALLDVPLPTLRTLTTSSPTLAGHAQSHLSRALHPAAPDGNRWVGPALALEPTFTGPLSDLLSVAATVAR